MFPFQFLNKKTDDNSTFNILDDDFFKKQQQSPNNYQPKSILKTPDKSKIFDKNIISNNNL